MRVGSTFSTIIINKLLILIINIFSYLLLCKKIISRTNNKRAHTPGTGGTVFLVPTISVQSANDVLVAVCGRCHTANQSALWPVPPAAWSRPLPRCHSGKTPGCISVCIISRPRSNTQLVSRNAPWYNLHSLPPYILPSIPSPTHRQPLSRKPHWPILHSSSFPL